MFDSRTILRHTENRYVLLDNGQVVYAEYHRRSPELRNYSPAQLIAMLENAGFTKFHAVSGYTSEPASVEDETFCTIGSRM